MAPCRVPCCGRGLPVPVLLLVVFPVLFPPLPLFPARLCDHGLLGREPARGPGATQLRRAAGDVDGLRQPKQGVEEVYLRVPAWQAETIDVSSRAPWLCCA
jgi:hypothetical protein